jgi:NTP pyrophosphatase (non-canonical NTP hydrolase)
MSILARIATAWAARCFPEQITNLPERSLRTVEEAIELCQAFEVPKKTILMCVENVYSKPPGDVLQELGGTLMTANILCEIMGVEADKVMEIELQRVLAKPTRHFADRNESKLKIGLGVSTDA